MKAAIINQPDFEKLCQYIMNVPISPSLAGKCLEVQDILKRVQIHDILSDKESAKINFKQEQK